MRRNVITLFKDLDRKWRWIVRDKRNDRIIGHSHEGYSRRIDALANLRRVTGRTLVIGGRRHLHDIIRWTVDHHDIHHFRQWLPEIYEDGHQQSLF